MKRRFREVLELVEYEELIRIKDDLNKGGDSIKLLVDNKLKEETKKRNEFCTICAAKVNSDSSTRFVLEFGPEELKRKVSFCAVDCMEYFLSGLKQIKND